MMQSSIELRETAEFDNNYIHRYMQLCPHFPSSSCVMSRSCVEEIYYLLYLLFSHKSVYVCLSVYLSPSQT